MPIFHDSETSHRKSAALTPRAQRFPVQTHVWYRASGNYVWSPGEAVNISRSGILLRTRKEIRPRTLLEMRLVFPSELTEGAPVDVICWGAVVRKEESSLAASILHYHFKRK